jgi:hypothetical protein
MDIQTTTRRTFIKKTTALAVGISATTLFSGLVHAAGAVTTHIWTPDEIAACKADNANGLGNVSIDGFGTCTSGSFTTGCQWKRKKKADGSNVVPAEYEWKKI